MVVHLPFSCTDGLVLYKSVLAPKRVLNWKEKYDAHTFLECADMMRMLRLELAI